MASPIAALVAKASTSVTDIETWYRRLGHISIDTIVKLEKSQMVKRLEIFDPHPEDKTHSKSCVGCQKRKQHRLPFPSVLADNRRDEPGELIHSDLFGPIQAFSIGGNKYGTTYTDDTTRECQAVMIPDKFPSTILVTTFKRWPTLRGRMGTKSRKCARMEKESIRQSWMNFSILLESFTP
jgi:GAG-pre-integrase domain